MKIVIIDDDNLVSLSLNTIMSAQDDIEVSAVGEQRAAGGKAVRGAYARCDAHGYKDAGHDRS